MQAFSTNPGPSRASGAITTGTFHGNNEAVGPVLALDDIVGGIARTNNDLSEMLMLARDYADTMLGGEPMDSNGGAAKLGAPTPSGRLYGLREVTEMNGRLVNELRRHIERIRTV